MSLLCLFRFCLQIIWCAMKIENEILLMLQVFVSFFLRNISNFKNFPFVVYYFCVFFFDPLQNPRPPLNANGKLLKHLHTHLFRINATKSSFFWCFNKKTTSLKNIQNPHQFYFYTFLTEFNKIDIFSTHNSCDSSICIT